MTIERQAVRVTSPSGEPRGIQLTEETFGPSGLVVSVSGELDIATAPVLRDHLTAAIEAGKHRIVKKELPPHGKLALAVDPSSYVMLIFESGGLTKVLDLVATRAEAIEHVSS